MICKECKREVRLLNTPSGWLLVDVSKVTRSKHPLLSENGEFAEGEGYIPHACTCPFVGEKNGKKS